MRVVSASDRFLFNPSLIRLPFGKRKPADITFPLSPTFEERGVDFVHGEAARLDLGAKRVETSAGTYGYDYLVIATGYRNDFDAVPGLREGSAYTITTLDDAIHAGEGWRKFLDRPGDVVIGASPGCRVLRGGFADDKGYVKVRDTYQTERYDEVYAVGIAAAVAVPWQTGRRRPP